jgi:hypothetical protein
VKKVDIKEERNFAFVDFKGVEGCAAALAKKDAWSLKDSPLSVEERKGVAIGGSSGAGGKGGKGGKYKGGYANGKGRGDFEGGKGGKGSRSSGGKGGGKGTRRTGAN